MNYPSFVVFLVLVYKCHSKCVMYEACANLSPLYAGQSPFESKWQNCRYDGEPLPVQGGHAMDLFKKLCPDLYNGDDRQALCCSANQIRILTKSISEAEALIGSCPACYFNFRNFWCQITCHPDQHRFVQATEYQYLELNNFTHLFAEYEKIKSQTLDYENYDYDNEEENGPVAPKQRQKVSIVSTINVYMNREYLTGLIDSCVDIKLYGSDVLQGFCGVPGKQCTPEIFGYHMGHVIKQNPFKMNFILNQTDEKMLPIIRSTTDNTGVTKQETVDFLIKPIMPKFFMCNESFKFGDLDYGSKCSCKVRNFFLIWSIIFGLIF